MFSTLIFKLDNNPDILKFVFRDGTVIWPILRWQIRSAHMQSQGSAASNVSNNHSNSLFKYLFYCYINRPKKTNKIDILSIVNYEGNPQIPNRMSFFLKDLRGLKFEEWLYSNKNTIFNGLKNTYSFDYLFYKAWIESKFTSAFKNKDKSEDINILISLVEQTFTGIIKQEMCEKIRGELLFIDKVIVRYRAGLKTALKRNQPNFILTSEGNNGEWKHAVLFQVARELQIPTGEVQHGVFNIGMNYGEKLAKSAELKKLKSDYQFVFGPYHQNLTNAPVECIPFGHYVLQKAAVIEEHQLKSNISETLKITFICEGNPPTSINNEHIRQTYNALTKLSRPFKLVVRLHPSEGPSYLYNDFFRFEGTRYSDYKSESIYSLITESDCIICHASTVVFEAIYFNKPVLVLRDENTDQYIPPGLGISFHNAQELLKLLSQDDIKAEHGNDENYWTRSSVQDNFLAFWKKYISE